MSDRGGGDFGAFLFGFLMGGVVGGVTALLLAPQSGEETREQLRQTSVELREKADAALVDARAKV